MVVRRHCWGREDVFLDFYPSQGKKSCNIYNTNLYKVASERHTNGTLADQKHTKYGGTETKNTA